jgi:hypothetical protein
MSRYRIVYRNKLPENVTTGEFVDVESNSLAHALWETAKEFGHGAELVDTMVLPSRENTFAFPYHVDLYPNWEKENNE